MERKIEFLITESGFRLAKTNITRVIQLRCIITVFVYYRSLSIGQMVMIQCSCNLCSHLTTTNHHALSSTIMNFKPFLPVQIVNDSR